MIELPEDVSQAPSLEIAAERLGQILGLKQPAPLNATQRALDNPLYARALLTARKMPAVRQQLLVAPETVNITPLAGIESKPPPASSLQIIAKSAAAVLKWGADGLKHAEPWVIERRLSACGRCEFQTDAPDTLIYRGAKVVVGKDAKICEQCACLTNTKAALAIEHCPEKDLANPELSRWQEPWVDTDKLSKWPWR